MIAVIKSLNRATDTALIDIRYENKKGDTVAIRLSHENAERIAKTPCKCNVDATGNFASDGTFLGFKRVIYKGVHYE